MEDQTKCCKPAEGCASIPDEKCCTGGACKTEEKCCKEEKGCGGDCSCS